MTEETVLPPISSDEKIPLKELKEESLIDKEQEQKSKKNKKLLLLGILLGFILAAGVLLLIIKLKNKFTKKEISPSPTIESVAPSNSASPLASPISGMQAIKEKIFRLEEKLKSIEGTEEKLKPVPVLDFKLEFEIDD